MRMSDFVASLTESGPSGFLPNHDICERIAGLENRLLAKMNQRPKLGSEGRGVNVGFGVRSDLGAFGQFQSVLHVNAQVAYRAVDLGMAKKDLNGAEVASRLVDD